MRIIKSLRPYSIKTILLPTSVKSMTEVTKDLPNFHTNNFNNLIELKFQTFNKSKYETNKPTPYIQYMENRYHERSVQLTYYENVDNLEILNQETFITSRTTLIKIKRLNKSVNNLKRLLGKEFEIDQDAMMKLHEPSKDFIISNQTTEKLQKLGEEFFKMIMGIELLNYSKNHQTRVYSFTKKVDLSLVNGFNFDHKTENFQQFESFQIDKLINDFCKVNKFFLLISKPKTLKRKKFKKTLIMKIQSEFRKSSNDGIWLNKYKTKNIKLKKAALQDERFVFFHSLIGLILIKYGEETCWDFLKKKVLVLIK